MDSLHGRLANLGTKGGGFDAQVFALGDDPATAARLRDLTTSPIQMTAADRLLQPAQETASNTRMIVDELRQIRSAFGMPTASLEDRLASIQRQEQAGASGRFANQTY